MKRSLYCLFGLTLALTTSFVSRAQEESITTPARVTLNFQSIYSAETESYRAETAWASHIYELTDGEVAIAHHPADYYVGFDETLDGLKLHVLDGHITYLGYFADQDPAFSLLGDMVGAFSKPEQVVSFLNSKAGHALMKRVHDDSVVYLGGLTKGFDSLVAKKPIHNIEEMQKVKTRAPSGLVSAIISASGAQPMNTMQSEVKPALKSSLIELADYSTLAANKEKGLYRVAPYAIYPGFHSMITLEVAVSKEKWQKISAANQRKIKASVKSFAEKLLRDTKRNEQATLTSLKADPKVSIISWSDDSIAAFNDIAKKARHQLAVKSKKGIRVEQALTDYLH